MRTVAAVLIIAAGLVTAAQAQAPSTPMPSQGMDAMTQPAPAAAQPTAPAPAAPAAAAPAAPVAGAPVTGAPAPAEAAPAAAAPAPAAEAPPTLPTTGDGAVVISFIEKVCVPLVRGGKLDDLAKAYGMKLNRRDGSWTIGLGGDRNYNLTVYPVGANKDVCRADIHYATGQSKPIVEALVVWSFLHQPELVLQANYVAVDPDGIKRVRKSWEHLDPQSSTAVNFSTLSKPDDTPLAKGYDSGEIFYQERKLG